MSLQIQRDKNYEQEVTRYTEERILQLHIFLSNVSFSLLPSKHRV